MNRTAIHLAALATVLATVSFSACQQPEKLSRKPQAVIFLLADGMGSSHISFARNLNLSPGEHFAFETLPTTGLVSTYSASNFVTDSAAAATAFSSGVKANNRTIGMDPDGNPLETIADRAQQQGWKIGYVTDTEITHATPAAFYAAVQDRYLEVDAIALQLLDQSPDVALGGGKRHFLPQDRYGARQDGRDLLTEARQQGYEIWEQGANLGEGREEPFPDKLLGLFASSHIPYVIDNQRLPSQQSYPSLAELTRVALRVLAKKDNSFFLLVEGGRIDHAGHSFDAVSVAAQVEAFDEAVEVVLQYQQDHPATLVVVTSDHATGGLAINDFVDWDSFGGQKASNDDLVADLRDPESQQDEDYLAEMTGYAAFSPEHVETIRSLSSKYDAARLVGTLLSDRFGITWLPRVETDSDSTDGHTGEDVPLYAGGPGAHLFGGTLDNTEIPQRLCRLLGWSELNPTTRSVKAAAGHLVLAEPDELEIADLEVH